eukprot:3202988-Pyramimonas_sp.AAC.1
MANVYKQWLECSLPEWKDFHIVATVEHLGPALGPAAPAEARAKPAQKWPVRAAQIARESCPTGVAEDLYNKRAVNTLSYVAQFAQLPLALPGAPSFRGLGRASLAS